MTARPAASANYAFGIIHEEYRLHGTSRVSYGIAVYADPKIHGSAIVVAAAHDLTADPGAAESLARMCEQLSLSPTHFSEIIDDFFGS